MITCKFWVDALNGWGDPVSIDTTTDKLRITDRFDETFSGETFTMYSSDCPYALPIEAWTKARITLDDGSERNYFVESYNDELATQGEGINGEYRVYISLIEQVKVTQSLYPDSLTNSNLIRDDGQIQTSTIANLLNRVREQLWTMPEAQKGNNLDGTPFDFYFVQYGTWQNMVAPEMFFTDFTLFEILEQVGQVVGGFPQLDWDEEIGKYWLTFRFWNDNNVPAHEDTSLVGLARHTGIDGQANCVVSNLANLQNMSNDGSNTVVFPCRGGFKALNTSEYTYNITPETLTLNMPYSIARVIKAEVWLGLSVYYADISALIIDYDKWVTLPEGISALLQPYTENWQVTRLYYKRNDNKIYNVNNAFYAIWSKLIDLYPDDMPRVGYSSNGIMLRVTYQPYQSARVRTYKADGLQPIQIGYNQGANVVSSTAIARNLKGLVQRLEGKFQVYQKTVERGTPVYAVGDLLNGQRIVEADFEIDNALVNCLYTTAEFNRRSEFVETPHNLRLWLNPSDKIANRELQYGEECFVEINAQGTAVSGGLTFDGRNALVNYGSTTITPPSLAYVAFRSTQQIANDTDIYSVGYALATVTATPFDTSVLMTWKMADNVSMGERSYDYLQAILPTADRQMFVGVLPNSEYLNFKISSAIPTQFNYNAELTGIAVNGGSETAFNKSFELTFPLSNKQQYSAATALVDFGQWYIQKDIRERIGFNYQLDFVGKNGTIIYPKAVALNRLCNPNPLTQIRVFKNSATPYSPYETNYHSDATEITVTGFFASVAQAGTDTAVIVECIVGSYNNLAITDGNGELMFATNTSGTVTTQNLVIGFTPSVRTFKKI